MLYCCDGDAAGGKIRPPADYDILKLQFRPAACPGAWHFPGAHFPRPLETRGGSG
jgi:hypothetical protein